MIVNLELAGRSAYVTATVSRCDEFQCLAYLALLKVNIADPRAPFVVSITGLKLGSYSLDYSMTPLGELGNVQRLSLIGRF